MGCFKIVSDEMASDQIQSGPEALPELNRDDLMEILAEQENEMNEELQENARATELELREEVDMNPIVRIKSDFIRTDSDKVYA